MKRDAKLSGMLHVLLHMLSSDGPMTSESLAAMMGTNPVVIRRLMAGLRDDGFVSSAKGHGGGWTIARDPASITLADIYGAVGAPDLVALGHRSENPSCLVEQAVNARLDAAFQEVSALFGVRMGEVTLADLSQDFNRRLAARGQTIEEQTHAL